MPQAQPELKKVCSTPLHPYTRSTNRETRRTRHKQDRNGKSKESKWTDPRLQYLDKRLFVQLNGSRKVIGVLRGYDVRSVLGVVRLGGDLRKVGLTNVSLQVFLNIVLDDAVEEKDGGEKVRLGMVVRLQTLTRIGGQVLILKIGHSRKFGRHARGVGENRRRTRR